MISSTKRRIRSWKLDELQRSSFNQFERCSGMNSGVVTEYFSLYKRSKSAIREKARISNIPVFVFISSVYAAWRHNAAPRICEHQAKTEFRWSSKLAANMIVAKSESAVSARREFDDVDTPSFPACVRSFCKLFTALRL